jgi:hypothetical protein
VTPVREGLGCVRGMWLDHNYDKSLGLMEESMVQGPERHVIGSHVCGASLLPHDVRSNTIL